MRSFLACFAALACLAAAAPGYTQEINITDDRNDPVTHLTPAKWELVMSKVVRPNALIGLPEVLIVSSVNVPLTVTCGRWTLVGPNPYSSVAGNPAQIDPFSITPIRTNEFDGYCRTGVVGHTPLGQMVTGRLTSTDGTFTNATVITFHGDQLQ